jgi:Cdc6-like AAA superfamily ATPase
MFQEQKQAEAREHFLSKMLSSHAVTNVSYDKQGKRPCDPDTRTETLQDIKNWIYDVSPSAQCFLWLTGDPGSGKSAITASTAKLCKDEGVLWAQFFINRNNADTTNPASYFPSIAQQLGDRSPAVSCVLHDALQVQQSLMDEISHLQAGELFVNALKVAASIDPSRPVVVIIDGLDETERSALEVTAKIFSKAVLDLPCNVKIFISSRTEDDIVKPFTQTFGVDQVKHIHLDTSAPSSIPDVSTFLIFFFFFFLDHHFISRPYLLHVPRTSRSS